VGEYSW